MVISILLFIKKKISFIIPFTSFPLILIIISFLYEKENLEKNNTLDVRVVQPNILQKEKWDKSLFQQHVDKLLRLSERAKKNSKLIVVWPEAAMTVYLNENKIC